MAILGAAAALAVSLTPSIVFPMLLVFTLRQMSVFAMFALMATHAIVTVAAAVFGYVAVIALRETMVAVLGWRWFTRVSPWAQGVLIVVLGASLLLLVPASDRIAQRGFDGWRAMSPPMWFIGAYEMTAGGADRGLAARADVAAKGEERSVSGPRSTASGAARSRRWPGARDSPSA